MGQLDGPAPGALDEADDGEYESLSAEQLGNGEVVYVSGYDGADVDARLTAALNDVSNGATIVLERGTYNSDYTISKNIFLQGVGGVFKDTDSAFLAGDFTFDGRVRIDNVRINDSVVRLNTPYSKSTNCLVFGTGALIEVNADNCVINAQNGGEVTFLSGTSGCIIDSSASVSVTDNGTNTIGDIA